MNAKELDKVRHLKGAVRLKDSWTSVPVVVLDGPFTKSKWGTVFHAAPTGAYWLVKAEGWRDARHVLSRQLITQADHDLANDAARNERLAREAREKEQERQEKALLDALEAALARVGIDHRPWISRSGVVLSERVAQLLADALAERP